MSAMRYSGSDARHAFTHPLFGGALASLIVNDHVLKRVHVLPGWLTGKLSDFAGMLIAPVLMVALFRVRGRVGRMAVFFCVAGVFAAVKLFRSFADVIEQITICTPMPWRLWCDPTDLVALTVLPLGWWLVSREYRADGGSRLSVCLQATGFGLGLFACAATSATTERYRGTAFLFNGTMRTQRLSIYRLQSPLDCSRAIVTPMDWPGPDAFVLQSCSAVAPREVLPLDRGWKDLGTWDGLGTFSLDSDFDAGVMEPACDAVLLQAEGLKPVVITWNGVRAIQFSGAEEFGDDASDPHGLVLERAGDRLFIKGTSLLNALPAGFEPGSTTCHNGER